MTPAHHRAVFVAFAMVATGVAVNAVLLQPQPASRGQAVPSAVVSQAVVVPASKTPDARPAGQVHSVTPTARVPVPAGPMEQGARRFARLRPDAAHMSAVADNLPEAPDTEGDANTISAVQRELSTRGYGPLTPDGVAGLVTRAAIMAYEFDHRMPLRGEATASLLARIVLGLSGDAKVTDPSAGRVRSPQADIVMRTLQQSLVALGYDVGKIDGRPGEEIARAIREFEVDQGLKPTGRVSAEIFNRLGHAVAGVKPRPVP